MSSADAPSSEVSNRTLQRRERTRLKLTEAAAGLIAEKGVSGLRIQELAERADVALGSFYNHFASKEELVEAVVTGTINVRAQTIVAEMASLSDPAEIVAFAARRVIRIAYDEPELAWLFVNLDRADALFEGIVLQAALRPLDAGIASGRFDIADPHLTLTAMVGGALALMRGILDGRYGSDADSAFAEGQLRALGLDRRTARRIASQPLSTHDEAAPRRAAVA